MPRRRRAGPHFCGGSAFVKISAAWSSVLQYSNLAESSWKTSERPDMFILWVLAMRRSFEGYPLRTTRMVA